MVFLDFIICGSGGEEKVQELLLPLLPPGRAQIPRAALGARECGFARGSGVPLLPLTGSFSSQGIIPRDWKAEEREGEGKNCFLSCSRVTGFLQLSLYSKTYSWNSSFPVFIIRILPSSWLFVTTPSLLSGWKHFQFLCCIPGLLPDVVQHLKSWSFGQQEQCGRIQTCTAVHCLKPLTRRKTVYLISLAERS